MIKVETNLNEGQVEALSKMIDWVKLKGFESTFGLYGKAGTGKTTVTKEFINNCGISKHRIAVSAPTHKAKRVIERITGLQGHTLQSLLGLRLDLDLADYDPNDPKFTPQAEPTISDYKVVIIDECSMVNAELEETLVKQSKIYGVKLLYLGDPNQLPPVGEILSNTFTNPNYKYTLTEVMRQNFNNPLTQLLNTLVEDIQNNTNNYRFLLKNIENFNDKGEGYVITNNIEYFGEMVTNKFTSTEFTHSIEHCKYLSWTNDSVRKWNNYIRKQMFNSPTEDIVSGEVLLAYKTLLSDKGNILVNNSEEYIVQKFESVFSSPNNTDCYKISLVDIDFQLAANLTFVKRSSMDNFKEVLIKKQNYARDNRAWRSYYKWKDSFLITQNIIIEEYGKKRQISPKDFDYGYGVTVHKSQGSTYDAVFVNAADILRNFDEVEKKKLLYVALSRAKNQAAILI